MEIVLHLHTTIMIKQVLLLVICTKPHVKQVYKSLFIVSPGCPRNLYLYQSNMEIHEVSKTKQ